MCDSIFDLLNKRTGLNGYDCPIALYTSEKMLEKLSEQVDKWMLL